MFDIFRKILFGGFRIINLFCYLSMSHFKVKFKIWAKDFYRATAGKSSRLVMPSYRWHLWVTNDYNLAQVTKTRFITVYYAVNTKDVSVIRGVSIESSVRS